MKPLSGIRVLDVSDRIASAWCSRLLADFGAEVLLVSDSRQPPLAELAPFDARGQSIPALYFHANKHIVTRSRRGDALADLIREADIVLTSAPARRLEHLGLDDASLRALNPEVIHCAVTPFGLEGERADFPANDLTLYALSGWGSLNGLTSGPPLKGSGYQAGYQAGTLAYSALVAALLHRLDGGPGQQVDIAELDVLCSTFAPAILGSSCRGIALKRRTEVDITGGPVPVRDGYFALTISRAHFWIESMNLLGLPELANSKDLQQSWYRQRHREEFAAKVAERMAEWTRMDLFNALAERRVIAGPVLDMAELGANEHLRTRGFFTRAESAKTDSDAVEFPGPPFKSSSSLWSLGHARPAVVTGFTGQRARPTAARSPSPKAPHDGPLSGYRGVVLTQAWAGTYATQLMALAGAEVIQVEHRARPDSWRGQYDGPMPALLEKVESAAHPWNCNPLFNSVNLNKQSITLDLGTERGVALFRTLVGGADFVAENFSPRVMGNLGLGYEDLRRIKPDIILLSLSAYGHDGPWSNVPGIGGTLEPTSGMSALLGYEDGAPLNSGQMYPDAVAGLYGFASLTTALAHRRRTGVGQFLDLSMQEANFTFVGDAWLEYALNGTLRPRLGNRHQTFAPHGVYPVKGDDRWIAIACETGEQWAALCTIAQSPHWLADPRFVTNAARKRNEGSLDRAIREWTADCERDDLAAALARAGVIAAPILNPLEVAGDAALIARGLMTEVEHPETGRWRQPGVPFRMSHTSPRVRSAAPLQGVHGAEVLGRLAGVSPEEYAELVRLQISGSGPIEP